jgi:hypothetical protein
LGILEEVEQEAVKTETTTADFDEIQKQYRKLTPAEYQAGEQKLIAELLAEDENRR